MPIRTGRLILSLFVLLPCLRAEDHLKYGEPACNGPVLNKQYFVVCYDPAHKLPAWVGYTLTSEQAQTKVTSRTGSFRADPDLPRGGRAENADYTGSGYDRGHMAPANDFSWDVDAMKATFILSNAVPQRHGVNGGRWAQLEAAVHNLAAKQGAVWVFSGPVFVGGTPIKTIGSNQVAVPTHTYKVLLCVHPNGDKEMFGFLMPNINKPSGTISSHTFSVDELEKLTGLDFFQVLPVAEQEQLEAVSKELPLK
jgi:endonuclease G